MTFCYILAILFLAVAVLIILLAYNYSRKNRSADDNMKVKFLGMDIDARGFMGLALAAALGFGFLSFSFGKGCVEAQARNQWQGEVEEAKRAFDDALAARAEIYAPEPIAKARTDRDAMQKEVAKGDTFFGSVSATRVQELADEARRTADAAREAALVGKERAKQDAAVAIESAKTMVHGATELLAELEGCKRKPKGFARDLTLLKSTMDGLLAELPNLDAAFGAEDYGSVKSRADSIKQTASDLLGDVQAAMIKIKCE
ncbi:MAG TPA: hypothetical protein VF017_20315 [Thermoanaerobaculia bacterium]|nr:hypothetical protein [Thermoanaerobaculia bacterium]